jgi:hypothetical protein
MARVESVASNVLRARNEAPTRPVPPAKGCALTAPKCDRSTSATLINGVRNANGLRTRSSPSPPTEHPAAAASAAVSTARAASSRPLRRYEAATSSVSNERLTKS